MSGLHGGWRTSTRLHVVFAAVAMGTWATACDATLGPGPMMRAGLTQAALSGTITLGLKRALEALGDALPAPIASAGPPLLTGAAVLALLVGAHALAHTPHLWRVIALPYAVSSTYAWTYSFALSRRRGAGAAERFA